jgi:PhnB protein
MTSSVRAQGVIPAFACVDAAKAIEFYELVFGAKVVLKIVDPGSGTIGHAELLMNGGMVFVSEHSPGYNATPKELGGTTVKMIIMVDDVDSLVKRATDAGAEVIQPATDEFYGYRSATVSDPFGHVWIFQKDIENLTPAEMQNRWEALVNKKGTDTNGDSAE